MPANLGGDIVLEKASCIPCKLQIEKFENPCLRWWTAIRFKRGIGRRDVETRRKTFKLKVRLRPTWKKIVPVKNLHDPIGEWETLDIPIGQHPAPIVLAYFEGPGLLRGLTPEESEKHFIASRPPWMRADRPKPGHEFAEIKFGAYFDPVPFARLIAKIAHGVTVRHYGPDGFEPFLKEIIRGDDLSKLWYYVGGAPTDPIPVDRHISYKICRRDNETLPDYLVVEIRLFANLGAPIYYALVGQNPKDGGGLAPYGRRNR